MRGLIAGLFTVCVAARAFAQPAPPDFDQAKKHYDAGAEAMDASSWDEAAKEFLAAYEITKDRVLFFKIGSAYEKAGKCRDALVYYQRYLDEAKPAENFVTLTRERMDACNAPAPALAPAAPAPAPPPVPADKPAEAPAPIAQPSTSKDRAWLFVGGALTFVTAGAVLAYSTSSAEQDIKDLYISDEGRPPTYDGNTKERYENLIDEGRRYQYLAWTSFGLAAGCAIGATIFFLRDRGDVEVTPVVAPKQAGVSATLRF